VVTIGCQAGSSDLGAGSRGLGSCQAFRAYFLDVASVLMASVGLQAKYRHALLALGALSPRTAELSSLPYKKTKDNLCWSRLHNLCLRARQGTRRAGTDCDMSIENRLDTDLSFAA
jgi:hypothetical protein